jgi:hypothetical protein
MAKSHPARSQAIAEGDFTEIFKIKDRRWRYSSMILVTSTGGCGGFFASVLETGVTGQQQQASTVSAEFTVRGGAGGSCFFSSRGGATKPFSSDPSPASKVPRQKVAHTVLLINLWLSEDFIGKFVQA